MVRIADLLKAIDLIYEAALDMRAWPPATEALADMMGAQAVSLAVIDPTSDVRPFVVAPRSDPEWLQAYIECKATTNFLRERGSALPIGRVYQVGDPGIPQRAFERTSFYNEFFVPQRLNFALLANTAEDGRKVSCVGFYRSRRQGRFEREEERLFGALMPHLRRAVALNLRLTWISMQRDATAEMLNRCAQGVLLVDAAARLLFANPAAEAILTAGAGLCLIDGRLAACLWSRTAHLRAMIAGAAAACVVILPDRDGRSLAVEVLPVRIETAWLPDPPAAMVFIRDPKASRLPSPEQIRLLFGLTPAQAALAGEILEGDGIDAAAARLGIKRSTARTHLLEVFQKSGTSRQAELVRVILQKGRGHQPGDLGSARSSHPNEEANSTSEVGSDTVAAPARSSRKVWHWPLRAV